MEGLHHEFLIKQPKVVKLLVNRIIRNPNYLHVYLIIINFVMIIIKHNEQCDSEQERTFDPILVSISTLVSIELRTLLLEPTYDPAKYSVLLLSPFHSVFLVMFMYLLQLLMVSCLMSCDVSE